MRNNQKRELVEKFEDLFKKEEPEEDTVYLARMEPMPVKSKGTPKTFML